MHVNYKISLWKFKLQVIGIATYQTPKDMGQLNGRKMPFSSSPTVKEIVLLIVMLGATQLSFFINLTKTLQKALTFLWPRPETNGELCMLVQSFREDFGNSEKWERH